VPQRAPRRPSRGLERRAARSGQRVLRHGGRRARGPLAALRALHVRRRPPHRAARRRHRREPRAPRLGRGRRPTGGRGMRFGHHAKAWGGVVGHPVGVTSIKDLFYLTPGDTLATLGEVADAGYEGTELFDGDLAEFADDLGRLQAGLEERGLTLIAVYSGANLVFPEILGEELWRVRRACEWAQQLGAG